MSSICYFSVQPFSVLSLVSYCYTCISQDRLFLRTVMLIGIETGNKKSKKTVGATPWQTDKMETVRYYFNNVIWEEENRENTIINDIENSALKIEKNGRIDMWTISIQLFMYNSCCSNTLFYLYLTYFNSSMCDSITLLTSFIFRCLHNYPGESVWAGSCRKSTESKAGIIVLGIREKYWKRICSE